MVVVVVIEAITILAGALLRLTTLRVSAVVETDHVTVPRVVLHHKVLLTLQNLEFGTREKRFSQTLTITKHD